jgi:molybdate transport system regulatory protein
MAEETILLGPGKADLLAAVHRLGTLREAAAEMGMSYMRAWTLIRTMNEAFREPLVTTTRGGSEGGRAELTATGRDVLKLYRRMERESLRAMKESWQALRKMIR